MKFWIVDTFTDKHFSGNPTAVITVDEFPTDQICQSIAEELNQPATSFVKRIDRRNFNIRWFSPTQEMDLCGSGTLAAAFILDQESISAGTKVRYDTISGEISVLKSGKAYTLDFPIIENDGEYDKDILQELVDLSHIKEAVYVDNCAIVELTNEELVRNLVLDPSKVASIDRLAIIFTAQSKTSYDFVSRVFAPNKGINEDPATGSAHCMLADYWRKRLNKNIFHAYQASKRTGVLDIEIKNDRVFITGNAITVMKGEILI